MDIEKFMKEIEVFAEQIGRSPEYVCRKATNYPLFWERLNRRRYRLKKDAKKIRAFMKDYRLQAKEAAE